MDRESLKYPVRFPRDITSRSCRRGKPLFMTIKQNAVAILAAVYFIGQIVRWGMNGFRIVG